MVGGGDKFLPCDSGSEIRKGGSWKSGAKINRMGKRQLYLSSQQPRLRRVADAVKIKNRHFFRKLSTLKSQGYYSLCSYNVCRARPYVVRHTLGWVIDRSFTSVVQ